MFSVIKDFVGLKFGALNTVLTTDLAETTVSLDFEELPANQLDGRYEIRISEYERERDESPQNYRVNVVIKLSLGVYKKDVSRYEELIDTYVQPIVEMLREGETSGAKLSYTSGYVTLTNLENLKVSKTREIVKTNYIQPEISFDLKVIDKTPIGASVLGAVTLLTPSNGATITARDFTWSALAGATSYDIQILSGTTVVASQSEILITAWTCPESILVDLTTYTWQVRANNLVGAGTWSTAWSFTFSGISYDSDIQIIFDRGNQLNATDYTVARKALINTFIEGLKTDLIWDSLDVLVLLAGETAGLSVMDLKIRKDAAPMGAYVHTVDRGINPNGVGKIYTSYIPSIDAVNYTQNSASFGLYSRTDQAAATIADMHCNDSALRSTALYLNLGGSVLGDCNSFITSGFANTDTRGFFCVDRISAANFQIYKNGVSLGTVTAASTAVPTIEFVLGCRNTGTNGTAGFDRITSREYAMYYIAGGLGATKQANLYTRVQTFMTAIGAQV